MASLLSRTYDALAAGLLEGLHIGAQLYVSRRGEPLENMAIGQSRPGVMMSTDTLMLWLSASKPITAAAIMQLVERGRCQLDQPVASIIPEFGCRGKEPITLRHLLTHTGGFRWVDTGWPETTWDEIIGRISRAPLEPDWVVGETAGYHPYTSWYILGEVVRRLSGQSLADYVRQEIFLPLGMDDCWIGMPLEQIRAYGERIGRMQNTEKPGLPPHAWSSEEGIAHGAPGGGGYGPIAQLAFFYEALLAGGQRRGSRILSTSSVEAMIARQRVGRLDQTFGHVIDWGLGLILDSKYHGHPRLPYGYGQHASHGAFGHSGSQSSVAMADPEHALVVALVFNGMPGEARHQRRIRAVIEALYVDLGLVARSAAES